MSTKKILIVEDDEDIRELISFNLKREGYKVSHAETGKQAIRKALTRSFDLILLDLMLPEVDGLDVCRQIRADANARTVPIIMVTAKGTETDIVEGLELGADDYIAKPFSPKVLIARVRAVLRRKPAATEPQQDPVQIHDLAVDPIRHEVFLDGEALTLTSSEFQLLYVLARRPGWVFTRSQIVDSVKGDDYPVTERAVDVQIVGLRKKLGSSASKYIQTVRGVGYRFMEEDT